MTSLSPRHWGLPLLSRLHIDLAPNPSTLLLSNVLVVHFSLSYDHHLFSGARCVLPSLHHPATDLIFLSESCLFQIILHPDTGRSFQKLQICSSHALMNLTGFLLDLNSLSRTPGLLTNFLSSIIHHYPSLSCVQCSDYIKIDYRFSTMPNSPPSICLCTCWSCWLESPPWPLLSFKTQCRCNLL